MYFEFLIMFLKVYYRRSFILLVPKRYSPAWSFVSSTIRLRSHLSPVPDSHPTEIRVHLLQPSRFVNSSLSPPASRYRILQFLIPILSKSVSTSCSLLGLSTHPFLLPLHYTGFFLVAGLDLFCPHTLTSQLLDRLNKSYCISSSSTVLYLLVVSHSPEFSFHFLQGHTFFLVFSVQTLLKWLYLLMCRPKLVIHMLHWPDQTSTELQVSSSGEYFWSEDIFICMMLSFQQLPSWRFLPISGFYCSDSYRHSLLSIRFCCIFLWVSSPYSFLLLISSHENQVISEQ